MTEDKKDTAPQAENEEVKAQEIKEEVKAPELKEEAPAPETEAKAEKPESKAEKKESKKEEKKKAPKKPSLEDEMAALNDRYLRLCAEYDNFRRRSQKEKDNLYGDVKAEAVKQFLPVYDNLERALAQSTEDEAYRRGVEMIMTQFISTLEKLGVERIESQGEKFDPSFHNAVMHVDDEEKGENEIVEVFQQGFRLGDKIIRFAMVKVAN
ncbi:MAG: nucleotide exchange factor GrpE [Clostridia bacterium]|nr:MAG: nucleotide exchange factor GrpE [Clostridia bacterium]PWM15447.1 MAG: nucleotide exchange factor GrpE [Clostridia bacterium]